MRARKRFGQHFLTDEGVLHNIDVAIGIRANDRVMEIGPGLGALTDILIDQPRVYRAVEIDRDLVGLLRARHPQLELINEDILRADLDAILDDGGGEPVNKPEPWRVFGNLPYNISSPLLAVFTEFVHGHPGRVADMHFMLQREMAQRLTAQPGTKAWGRLSVMMQLHFSVEHVFDVGPESFSPPPKVFSSVVRLLPLAEPDIGVDVRVLDRLLRLAFSGRRKRISNSLKVLQLDWSQTTLDPGLRADNVSAVEYVGLAQLVENNGHDQ